MRNAALVAPLCSAVALLVAGCGGKGSRLTETRLGKIPDELSGLTFSPDGTRCAFAEGTDSGARMVLDGEPGPEYDDIAAGVHTFSLDSSRFLYVAVKGEPWVVVVDGEEGAPYELVAEPRPRFSPTGERVAYVAQEGERQFVVLDGREGKRYDAIHAVLFSPSGTRFAYIAERDGQQFIVEGGEEGEPYDEVSPEFFSFSPDSKRLAQATRRAQVSRRANGRWELTIGPGGTVYSSDVQGPLVWSAERHRLAFVARPSEHWTAFILDDPTSDFRSPDCGAQFDVELDDVVPQSLTLSPDDSRLAFIAEKAGKQFVIVDYDGEDEFDAIDASSLAFSDDGEHFAYVAQVDGRDCVVRDGVAGPAYDNILGLRYRPGTGQLCYVGSRGEVANVVEQGKAEEPCEGVLTDGFVFSPNGKRMAYAGKFYGKWSAVVDGDLQGEYEQIRPGSLRWSEDSRHFAFVAETLTEGRVVLDGEEGPLYEAIGPGAPTFRDGGAVEYLAYRHDTIYRIHQPPPE